MSNYIGNVGGSGSGTTTTAQSVTSSATPPSAPKLGDIWHDTDDDVTYVRIDSGGGNHIWLDISSASPASPPAVTSGSTFPVAPTLGDHHLDTDDGRIFIYIFDGTSNVWQDIS